MAMNHHRWQHRPYGVLAQPCDSCDLTATWYETDETGGRTRVVSRTCKSHRRILQVVR